MKTLDCERVNELLPLYVAGDLEDARAREVAAHVNSCAECCALAAEFDASRALLAEACEPPEFGEEFYAEIRDAVLSEIARDRLAPSKPSLLAALFPPRRLAFASAFALLLLASFVALRHFGRDAQEPQQQAGVQQQVVQETTPESSHVPQKISRTVSAGDGLTPSRPVSVVPNRREASAPVRVPKLSGSSAVAAVPRDSVNPMRAVATQTIASSDESNAATPPSESANAAAQTKVSRIEIQTADPNIRIIWLAPAKPEEPARDRDNRENGDRN